MKSLRGLPTVQEFFETYAFLILAIRRSGYAAQLVSGLTEIGGIFSAAYISLLPVFPDIALYAAAIIAVIGTAVIEIGLRVLLPHTVDAVLYKRFAGLYLPMTIAIWLCTAVLLAASGVLSFQNSKTIVKEYTPDAEQLQTEQQDSTWNVERAALAASFSRDSAMIAQQYETLIQAEKAAYTGRIQAKKTELRNIRRKESRTGQSYASLKDNCRAAIATLEADAAGKVATLEGARAEELRQASQQHKGAIAGKEGRYLAAVDSVGAINQAAIDERAGTVSTYGGGLAYFTIICLFILIASIVLDRIHRKGSGIKETVELSQYDVNNHWWVNLRHAVSERFNHAIQSRITAFSNKTPPAPLPADPSELYDPSRLANIQVVLKVDGDDETGEEGNVIYIKPKRRQIGFRTGETPESSRDLYSTRKQEGVHELHTRKEEHYTLTTEEGERLVDELRKEAKKQREEENEEAAKRCEQKADEVEEKLKASYETPNLREWKQRLKMYKKRLGSHEQKAIKLEQKGKPIPKRTLTAIENNEQWVQHYEDLINQATGRKA